MDRVEYERTYPNYCKACKGWGVSMSLSPDVRFSDCDCVRQHLCPQCGEKTLNDMYKCGSCGWDVCSEDRGLPGGTPIPATKCMVYPED